MRKHLLRRFLASALIILATSSAIASPRGEWSDIFWNPFRTIAQQLKRLLPHPNDDPAVPKP